MLDACRKSTVAGLKTDTVWPHDEANVGTLHAHMRRTGVELGIDVAANRQQFVTKAPKREITTETDQVTDGKIDIRADDLHKGIPTAGHLLCVEADREVFATNGEGIVDGTTKLTVAQGQRGFHGDTGNADQGHTAGDETGFGAGSVDEETLTVGQ